jgi:hypothetical protein
VPRRGPYTVNEDPFDQPSCQHKREVGGFLPGTDGEFHFINTTVTADFVRGQKYSTCVLASNATGQARQINEFGFPFIFGEPYVQYDGKTSDVTTTSATMSTQASASGVAAPAAFKVYKGACGAHAIKTVSAGTLPADYALHPLKETVTGLDPATSYCWDAQATNDVSTQSSADNFNYIEFTTLPLPTESLMGPASAGSTTAAPTGEVTLTKVMAGCGKGPCTYTSTATAPAASSSRAAASKAKRITVATGKFKLKTGQLSPIRLKLTKAGKKLLARRKAMGVVVVVHGVDAAGRKSTKTIKARFSAPKRR